MRYPLGSRPRAGPGETVGFAVRAAGLRRTIAVTMWSPPGTTPEDPLPMLALHDGPELAQLAAITQFSAAMIALGRLPAHRLALLSPGHRDSWYSASLAYAHALHRSVLPAVRNVVGVGPAPVLAGVSLGALGGAARRHDVSGDVGRPFPAVRELLPPRVR